MVILEALTLGVPAIITTACGIAEYLVDEVDCMKVEYGNENKLTQNIEKLLRDDNLWIALSNHGKIKSKELDWANIVKDYELKYLEIIGRRRNG